MNFFLEVGVYVLMVAIAAGGAGFVVFRLLVSARGQRRPPVHGHDRKREFAGEDGEESEEMDTPPPIRSSVQKTAEVRKPAAEVQKSSAEMPPIPDSSASSAVSVAASSAAATTSTSEDSGPASEATVPVTSAQAGEQAVPADASTGAGQQAAEQPVQEAGEADPAKESGDETEDSGVEPGTLQNTVAPPEEAEESEDDSFLAMFQGGDDEDSSTGDLANMVEECDPSELLNDARELTTTMKAWGGNHAQSR